ncbi:MAG TPA: DNA repair protein RadA, partial [Candidatus Eisenbacteria bacterium]|nr:DNA repair protein RadA [Candidatus Eisenbacteria bacterium]
MAKKASSSAALRTVFLCSACGNDSPKWFGRCPHCGEWNTAVEETARASAPTAARAYGSGAPSEPTRLADIDASGEERHRSGIGELDRVLGG